MAKYFLQSDGNYLVLNFYCPNSENSLKLSRTALIKLFPCYSLIIITLNRCFTWKRQNKVFLLKSRFKNLLPQYLHQSFSVCRTMDAIKKKMQAMKLEKDNAMDRQVQQSTSSMCWQKKNCNFCFARNEMRLKFLFHETVCSCLGGRWQQLPHEPPIPFIAVSPSHEAGEAA